jgi:uncharacterized protein with PIN domain
VSVATFRFYEELNDFLPDARRKVDFEHDFTGHPTVKDLVEALGVPHPEIDLILVNGCSVDFTHPVHDGDRVSVYPMFESLDISPSSRLRPAPLRTPRFVLDVHLGRLARYLRMLGFDTLYRNEAEDAELATCARDEQRILLTRDRGLLKRNEVTRGLWIRATQPRRQLGEVVERLHLEGAIRPFGRCTQCNHELEPVSKEAILHRLKPRTREHYQRFWTCPGCDRVYWRGSHFAHMRRIFDELGVNRA